MKIRETAVVDFLHRHESNAGRYEVKNEPKKLSNSVCSSAGMAVFFVFKKANNSSIKLVSQWMKGIPRRISHVCFKPGMVIKLVCTSCTRCFLNYSDKLMIFFCQLQGFREKFLSISWKYFAPNIKIKSIHYIITYIHYYLECNIDSFWPAFRLKNSLN